jgi:hypothetical protein
VKVDEIDCARIEERDLVPLYLAGRLPENVAEAFEAHYLACERCWADIQRASEIRAALGKPILVPLPMAGRRAHRTVPSAGGWRWLAVAAGLALTTLAVWQLAHRGVPPSEPVLRSGRTGSLPLQVEAGPGPRIVLRWPSHRNAQIYVAEVFTSDGVSVWRRETREKQVSLDQEALPTPRPGVSLLAKVEALDTMRQVVAKSELMSLPHP